MDQALKKQVKKYAVMTVIMVIMALAVVKLNNVTKTQLVNRTGQTFETGKVVRILEDNIQEDGMRVGQQTVVVKMTSGVKKGQKIATTSSAGYLFGAACKVGMRVVVLQSVAGNSVITSVYSMDRKEVMIGFVVLYLLALCLVGGLQGVKGALGLIFTFGAILSIYLPVVYMGYSPFWDSRIYMCHYHRSDHVPYRRCFLKKQSVQSLGPYQESLLPGSQLLYFPDYYQGSQGGMYQI